MLSHYELRRAYLAYNRRYFDNKLPPHCVVLFTPSDCYGFVDESDGACGGFRSIPSTP